MNALAENLGDTLSRLTPIPLPPPGSASAGTAPVPAPAPPPAGSPPTQLHPSRSKGKTPRRGNGKIPHLAKEHIDAINQFFDAGDTFRVVREKLAQRGLDVNLANLSSWYHGGYQDHLHARERRDQVLQTQQLLLEFARDPRAPDLTLVGLHLGVTQLSHQLLEMVPGPHKEHFQTDTAQYLRMLNTLARMSKSLLALQKYQDDSTKAQAAQLEHKDINRDLSDREYGLLVDRMDEVFKRRRRKPAAPPANGNGAASTPDASSATTSSSSSSSSFSASSSPSSSSSSSISSASAPISAGTSSADTVAVRKDSAVSQISSLPATPSAQTAADPSQSEVIQNPDPTPIQNPPAPLKSEISNLNSPAPAPEPPPPSQPVEMTPIQNQNSEITNPNPPGHCPACKLLLPPLLKNGERSIPLCPKCGSGLCPPPSWNAFDCPPPKINPSACDICRQRHQLDPNGLPDPCTQCGFHLLTHPTPHL